jgi:adenine phosphoribosyltransferase
MRGMAGSIDGEGTEAAGAAGRRRADGGNLAELVRRARSGYTSGPSEPQAARLTTHGSARMDLKDHIRGIADFPKPGILFYDISTLLREADAWQVAMGRMAKAVRAYQPDLLAGVESRGFLIAAPLALKLGCGFVMLRKRGKLPGPTVGLDYALEYGTDRIEMQQDAVTEGQRVVVVDDLLATGGTLAACIALLRRQGAVVPAAAALIELTFLGGRARLDMPVEALVAYDE